MKKTAQIASTQAFTEIVDIRDTIVLLRGNNACTVLGITSVNFALLSGEEQDAKVFAYAALLNSLSFPIQVLIRSTPVDITSYLSSLEHMSKTTTNHNLKAYIDNYRAFVASLITTTTVLDKQFYIIIPYSSLEAGAVSVVKKTGKHASELTFEEAQASLKTKAESLLSQIHRLSLQAEVLKKDALVKLFYDIYNQGESFTTTIGDIENPMVKGDV